MKVKEQLAINYAELMCGENLKYSSTVNEHILVYTRNAYLAGLEAGRTMAAIEAMNQGYTVDYEHQPWSHQANRWLRAQNKYISKRILKVGEEECDES